MKKYIIRLFLLCIFCLLAVICFSCSNEGGGPTAGGTETGNPTVLAKVRGVVVDSSGTPQKNVIMELLPASFNPVDNTSYPDTVVDVTDINGYYDIQADLDSGLYVLNGNQFGSQGKIIRKGIGVYDTVPIDMGIDTLQAAGPVSITIPDSLFVSGGYLYMPGTRISVPVDSPGVVTVDSVIPNLLDLVYYTSVIETPIIPMYSGKVTWSALNGPYGGNAKAFVKAASGEVFAASEYGGIFRFQQSGQKWNSLAWPAITMPSSYNKTANDLVVDSAGNLFASTVHNGILVSIDNGATWALSGKDYGYYPSLTVIPNGHIFVGDGLGALHRSEDNGNTWEQVLSITYGSNNAVQALVSNNQGLIFLGFRNAGIYVTEESGTGMSTVITTGIGYQEVQALALNSSSHVFLGTDQNGVYRSTDNGSSWVQINTGLTDLNVLSLAAHGSSRVFAGTNSQGIFQSQDNGNTWEQINHPALSALTISSLYITDNAEMYAGTSLGPYYSTDNGNTWSLLNQGFTGLDIMAIGIDASYVYAATLGRGIFRSADNGQNWTSVYSNGNFTYLFINTQGHIYSGPLKSINNGDTWDVLSGLSGYICAMQENSRGVLFASNDRGLVFRSLDDGNTWTTVGTFSSNFIETIAINSQDHVYVGTWSGEGIYRSTDGGDNWENTASTLGSIWRMAFNSQDHLFVAHGINNLWRSTDNGSTGQAVYQASVNKRIHSILIDRLDNIFISTDEGVFTSSDNGQTWQASSQGLNGNWVKCMALTSDNRLMAGTEGGGAFWGDR
jgi:photosystem II stability/assembly factor-like uncharacterized protein